MLIEQQDRPSIKSPSLRADCIARIHNLAQVLFHCLKYRLNDNVALDKWQNLSVPQFLDL